MATTPKVLLKRSSVIGRAPQPSDLQYGEIAINFADGKLYYKDANNNINAFIDSARVQAIAESVSALAESQLDSGEVIALIDSAYVQQRQDYDWNSLENIPSYVIGLDSAEVIRITLDSSEVIALIDSSHVRARQDYAYASLTGKPNILDSADIAILTLDSDEIKAFINSEYIRSFIDKTFIDGLNVNADTLDGQEGSYYSNYNNLTNKPLILDNIDVSNIITNDVDKAFVDALNVDADTLDGLNSTQFLRSDQSDSMRGSLTVDSNITVGGYIAGPETFYIDPAGVGDNTGRVVIRGDLQVDGTQTIVNSTTVSINDKNIVLADSAQNAAEADGAGITVNGANATITYNAANDEWQFNKDVQAPNIEATTIVATTITGEYTGFDSDFALKTTTDLTEGDNLYYTTARADSDFDVRLATKTTTDVAEGNNLYYTKARVDSDISQNVTKSFVDALNIDADTLDGQSGIFYLDHNNFINAPDIPAIVRANSVDSGEVINLVDSAYVQQRQDYAYTSLTGAPTNVSHFTNDAGYLTDTDTLDSEEAQGIIDSNFQNLTQSIIPANNNIDLGTLTNRFRDLYLGGNSLYIGNIKVTDSNGQIAFRDLSGNRVDISTLDPQVVALVDSAYVQARVDTAYIETLIDQVYLDSDDAIQLVDSAYVQQRQDYAYASLTGVPTNVSQFANDAGYLTDANTLDSEEVIGLVDSAYVQQRQDYAYTSLTGAPTNVSHFTNDANYLDSSTVTGVINNTYIANTIDSSTVTNIINNDITVFTENVDSAYIRFRQDYRYSSLTGVPDIDALTVDSAEVIALVDSAYVQQRMGTTTNLPEGNNLYYVKSRVDSDIAAAFTDSAAAVNVTINNYVQDTVDSAYVLARVAEAPFLDSADAIQLIDSAYVMARVDSAYISTVYNQSLNTTDDVTFNTVTATDFIGDLNGAVRFIGRADVDMSKGQVVYVTGVQGNTSTIDLARANNSSTMPAMGFVSADVLASNNVEVVTFGNLQNLNVANFGETGITFGPNDIIYVSASEAGRVTNVKPSGESNLIQNIGRIQRHIPTSNMAIKVGGAGRTNATPNLDADQFFLGNDSNYSVATDFTAAVTNVVDSAFVKQRVATDQDLRTTDSVTFSGLNVTGDLTVTGTTYQVNTVSYSVVDPLLHLADSNETSDVVDIGFVGHYNDGVRRHTGFFRDASNSQYYIFNGLIDSAFDSSLPTNVVDRSGTGFTLADLNVGTLHGIYAGFDADFGAKTTDDLAEGVSNLYYTTARHNSDFDIRLATKSTSNLAEGSNLYYTTARHDSDTLVQVDSAYVQARVNKSFIDTLNIDADTLDGQSGLFYLDYNNFINVPNVLDSADIQAFTLDSAEVIALIDSAYIQARQDYAYSSLTGAPNVLDSNDVIALHNSLGGVDSAAIQAMIESNFSNAPVDLEMNGNDIILDSANKIWFNEYAHIKGLVQGGFNQNQSNSIDIWGNEIKFSTVNGVSGGKYITNQSTLTLNEGPPGYSGTNGNSFGSILILPHNTVAQKAFITTVYKHYFDKGTVIFNIDSNQFEFYDSDGWFSIKRDMVNQSDVTTLIDSAYINSRSSGVDSAAVLALVTSDGFTKYDSDNTLGLIDSAYINARTSGIDSAAVTSIIDSAYITARAGAGTDSATVISLIQSTADSAYVQARQLNETATPLTQTNYNFTATLNQTVFGGMVLESGKFQVYLNGLLLPQADYTSTSSAVTLTVGANTGDVLEVIKFSGNDTGAQAVQQRHYIYTATSGQTVFTGTDDNSATLSYTQGRINVYLNGLLLLDSADYTQNAAGNTVTFTSGVTAGHIVNIQTLSGNTGSFAPLEQTLYEFTADSGQTIFTGADNNAATLDFSNDKITVYLNGILLSGNDYTPSSGNTITLDVGADSGNLLTVAKLSGNNIGLDSAQVNALIGASGPSGVDSAAIIALVDSAYVQARQTTGGSGTVDSAGVNTLINNYIIDADTALTTTTANQVVDTFSASTYRTAKYIIQMSHSSGYHSNEILLMHDGSTVYMTTYAEIITASSLGTIDADINSGNVRLLVTPTNTNTDINITRINVDV